MFCIGKFAFYNTGYLTGRSGNESRYDLVLSLLNLKNEFECGSELPSIICVHIAQIDFKESLLGLR
jgi:hypothetical protein